MGKPQLDRSPLPQRLRGLATAAGAVTAGAALANVLAYFVPLIGARHLDPDGFSVLATIMAVCAIAAVPSLGLQTAAAVHQARHAAVPGLARLSVLTAALTAAAMLIAAQPVAAVLHLPGAAMPLAAAMTVPVVLAGGLLGVFQGDGRFGRLALAMVLLGLARCGGVIVGLVLGLDVHGVLAAGAAGAWLALAAIAALSARSTPAAAQRWPGRRLVRDLAAASSATLAMFAVSYADLIAARQRLPAAEAASYAVLAVLTKGALWAPQVITVLALPYLARGVRNARLLAAGTVLGIGIALVAATAVAGRFAVELAGGSAYAHLGEHAPAFAATGALFALVFLLTNAAVAAGARAPAAPLWLAFAAFVIAVAALPAPSIGAIVTCALAAAFGCAALVGALSWRRATPAPALSQSALSA
jgi:hypothetical protein